MNRSINITLILSTLLLLLLQVLVFNHITLWGYATPIVYTLIVLKLPLSLHANWVLLIAFLLGLVVDMFSNTPGMNAFACSTLAIARYAMLQLIVRNEEEMLSHAPSSSVLGNSSYIYYIVVCVTLSMLALYGVQYFTLHNLAFLLRQCVASIALSLVLLFAIDKLLFGAAS